MPSLEVMLDSDVEVCAVYTQPDRPAGRGRKLRASPIKELALRRGLTLRQPADLDTEASYLSPLDIDLMVVVAYGLILPHAVKTVDLCTIASQRWVRKRFETYWLDYIKRPSSAHRRLPSGPVTHDNSLEPKPGLTGGYPPRCWNDAFGPSIPGHWPARGWATWIT